MEILDKWGVQYLEHTERLIQTQAWRSWTGVGLYSTRSILRGPLRDTGMKILDRSVCVQYLEHTESMSGIQAWRSWIGASVCTVPKAY